MIVIIERVDNGWILKLKQEFSNPKQEVFTTEEDMLTRIHTWIGVHQVGDRVVIMREQEEP